MSLASVVADRLVGEEMLTRRVNQPEARETIAREAGVSIGSLENLSRGRLKNTDHLASKLNALRIRKLEQRLASLADELARAKAMGVAPQVDIDRAEAALLEARQALGQG